MVITACIRVLQIVSGGDGMVEDIITALSRFKGLFVIARNSSFTYKGRAVDVKQVDRELGTYPTPRGQYAQGRAVLAGAVFVQKLAPGPPWAKRIHTVHRRCRKFQLGKCGVRGLLISMTDYYPLVRRAVADLEENTGETRLALLQRVRTVLVNELRSLTPPLTESEIARERVSLEEAIRKVEAEMMDRIQDERPRPPLAAPRELPLPEQEGGPATRRAPFREAIGRPARGAEPDRDETSGLRNGIRPHTEDRNRVPASLRLLGVFLVLVLAVLLYWQRDRLHAVLVRGPGEGTPTLSDHAGEVPATGQIDTGHETARATLYEEDSTDAQAKPQVGSVVWRTETASPGPGQPLELAIRAELEVPERHIKMTMTIRRNTDKALPATHTVEIMFNLPADFRFGGVSNVPSILMKQTERARGAPLAGLGVKVTSGVFLIGLSAVEADRERNLELLKGRSWFDIPIVYNNGRRAILTVEKGTFGERTFKEAFVAWGE